MVLRSMQRKHINPSPPPHTHIYAHTHARAHSKLQSDNKIENAQESSYSLDVSRHDLGIPTCWWFRPSRAWRSLAAGHVGQGTRDLLGRVLRNVEELYECLTEGYSLDTLVKVTQSMPWLETVYSVNPIDLASLSGEHQLQCHVWGARLPFMNDARTRVG